MQKRTAIRIIRRNGRLVGMVLALAAASGCVTIPAPIAPPSRGTDWRTVSTHAIGYGVARATVQTANGNRIVISGNGDHPWGDGDPATTVLPIVVPAAESLYWQSPEFDGSVFAGWRRVGFTSRLRLRETVRHRLGAFLDGNVGWTRKAYDANVGLEIFSKLSEGVSILLRLGPSFGRHNYAVMMPNELDASAGHDNTVGAAAMDIFRDDWRVEGMLGLCFRDRFLISLRPYHVLSTARLRSNCDGCNETVTLVDFEQNWGMVFMVSMLPANTDRP